MSWGNALPIFRIADLRVSLDYYVRVLGFTIDWQVPGIASVSRDRACIFLCESDQTSGPAWVWVGLQNEDVEELHRQLRSNGAMIRQGPTNFEWAMEFQIEDPDHNVLRIGSDPKPDMPYGPWLDASGRLWRRLPEGQWEQTKP